MYKPLLVSILVVLSPSGRYVRHAADPAAPGNTCTDVQYQARSGQTLPSALTFTPSGNVVKVEVHFVATYGRGDSTSLKTTEKQDVCEAARRFGDVWSSKEFQDAVTHAPDFIPGNMFWFFPRKRMAGGVFIGQLTQSRTIVMNVSGSTAKNTTGNGGCAASLGMSNETLLDEKYLAGKNPNCGPPDVLVAALTNTLSHEYTHYVGSIGPGSYSTDKGHGKNDKPYYISYGIGCITQLLAFPGTKCLTGAQPGPPLPDLRGRTAGPKTLTHPSQTSTL